MKNSSDYALQVAMLMEQRGLTFYQSLAEGSDNPEVSALAARLAAEELRHLQTFENMRNALPADQRGPKMTEEQITAAAGNFYKLILPTADKVREVAIGGDTAKILTMAIQMEMDAVAYYGNMTADFRSDADVIKAVIEEEKKHLNLLRDYRKQVAV
ncbi:MAG: ferritin family protein [Sedimentisphaerales bacterium]